MTFKIRFTNNPIATCMGGITTSFVSKKRSLHLLPLLKKQLYQHRDVREKAHLFQPFSLKLRDYSELALLT